MLKLSVVAHTLVSDRVDNMIGLKVVLGAAAAALLPAASAQFVSPPTDLINATGAAGYNVRYKEVPNGICETIEGVKSYSGYVPIDCSLRGMSLTASTATLMSLRTSTFSSSSSRREMSTQPPHR